MRPYTCIYVCTCVRMRLCPVKYEHAGVKPAIDRGKRREKEAAGMGVKRHGGLAQPHLLRRRATGVCSFNSGIFLRFADSDCLSRHPVSIYLSRTLFCRLASTRNPRLLCAIASAVENARVILEIAISLG